MKIFLRPAPGTIRLTLFCLAFLALAWWTGTAGGEIKPYSTQFIHATGTYSVGSQSLIKGTEAIKEVNFYNKEGQKELTVICDSLGHWWVHWTFMVQDTEKIQYEYKTMRASSPNEIDREINRAVKEGWVKDGELKVSSGGFMSFDIYCQPMKRRKP